MSDDPSSPDIGTSVQMRLAALLLVLFVVGLVLAWALSPSRTGLTERLLGNIALPRESGFDDRFGAFPELVKDQGGAVPVPPEPTAPQRTREYRGLAWLNMRPASGYTLQVAVMSHERAVVEFLFMRPDRDRFVYFKVPVLPDPADPLAEVRYRYAVCYGEFASRDEALTVAPAISGLPGQALVRSWGHYQRLHAEVPEPVPVDLVPATPAQEGLVSPAGASVQPSEPEPLTRPEAMSVPGGVPVTSLPAVAERAGGQTGPVGERPANAR